MLEQTLGDVCFQHYYMFSLSIPVCEIIRNKSSLNNLRLKPPKKLITV